MPPETSTWKSVGSTMSGLFSAAEANPYIKAGKMAFGGVQMIFGAAQKQKEARAKIGQIDDQLAGLQTSMKDLGAATEAKKEVGRGEFDTGVTQLGKSTSYGMEDITSGSQSAAKKSGLISGDYRAEERRKRTTETHAAQTVKQEDAFSREMMGIDEMYSAEANKIEAQTASLNADKRKLGKQTDFMTNLFEGLMSA